MQRRVAPRGVPAPSRLRQWALAALDGRRGGITLRVVGNAESRALNRRFRGQDKPTNVLSFPYEQDPLAEAAPRRSGRRAGGTRPARQTGVFGDIILCAPVVRREAREQGKAPAAHWAHMVVHGVLHLQGLDHIRARDAKVMEARERAILARLSFPDPYAQQPSR